MQKNYSAETAMGIRVDLVGGTIVCPLRQDVGEDGESYYADIYTEVSL